MQKRGNPNWQKGVSGNPSGRKPVPWNLKQMARENAEKALRRLIELIDSKDEKVALMASNMVLDRGYGKPEQRVDADVVHRFAEVPQVMEKAQWLATRGDPSKLKVIEHQPADPNKKLN